MKIFIASRSIMVKQVRRRLARKGAIKKRVGYRKRYIKKRSNNVSEYASLSCKRTLVVPGNPPTNFAVNQTYNLMNTQLIDYQRAVQVAAAYQHYRIKKITMTFKPTYDTFTNGNQSKMHLYFMLDKAGSIPTNTSLEGLKQMGARPFALDEKERKVSWSPSVLESAMYQPGVGNNIQAKYQVSPWLSTQADPVSPGLFQPSGIDHLGIYWHCQQLITQGTVTQYEIEVEVQFQFKKPLVNNLSSSVAIGAQVAELNDSKDGIVGGSDGV